MKKRVYSTALKEQAVRLSYQRENIKEFYRWFTSGPTKRAIEHSLFTDLVKQEFDKSKGRYGSTRIGEQLKRNNYCISRTRVSKIMKQNNWVSKYKKKFKVTTNSNHSYPVCRNLLNRNFNPSR